MLKNMKIKKGLMLGFSIVIVLSIILVAFSMVSMMNMRSEYELLMEEDVEANQDILYCRVRALIPGRNIRDALLIPDSDANDGLIEEAEQYLVELEEGLVSLEEHFPYQLDKEILYAYQEKVRAWAANAPKIIEMYRNYRSTGDEAYLKEAEDFIYETDTPMQTEMGTAAVELDNYLVEGMKEERQRIEDSIATTMIIIIAVSVAAVVVSIIFALVLIKSITAPTEEVRKALVGFSEGKLDIPVSFESKNELGEMCQALRNSQNILGDVIGDLNARRGQIQGMEAMAGTQRVNAFVPLAQMFGYATDLRSKTQGRGQYVMEPSHYEPVPKNIADQIIAGRTKG